MTSPTMLILASASPARTKLLADAGIRHTVLVSDVDEDAVTAGAGPLNPAQTALLLARAKAESVAGTVTSGLILGCDSVFELNGLPYGKPWEPEVARARWRQMRGKSGTLHTGHWLISKNDGTVKNASTAKNDGAAPLAYGQITSAVVHFEDVTDAEIEAYVTTGEPLEVAGAFTIDGFAGAFISGIEGDHHTVVGLSISTLRKLLARAEVSITEFWN